MASSRSWPSSPTSSPAATGRRSPASEAMMDRASFTAAQQYLAILPELIVLATGMLVLAVDMLWPRRRELTGPLGVGGLAAAILSLGVPWSQAKVLPGGHVPFLLGHGST